MTRLPVLFASAGALLLGACGSQQRHDSGPSAYIEAPVPDWAKTMRVDVRKRSAYVFNASGQKMKVSRTGTDIGNGLMATRDRRDLYVQDAQGVKCNWNSAERLDWCRMPNPARAAYLNAQANLRF